MGVSEEDIELADEVRKYPALYDKSCGDYRIICNLLVKMSLIKCYINTKLPTLWNRLNLVILKSCFNRTLKMENMVNAMC